MLEALGNFHFIRPVWLLLVPVSMVAWWIWRRRADPLAGWRQQMDPELLAALTVGSDASRQGPARLVLLGWLLAALAISGPTWRQEPSPFGDGSSPLVILLKADLSMDTPDPSPSRIERAHLKIADLVGAREGQPLGLIAYSGSAHLVLPPTADTAVVTEMAAEITPAIMPTPGDRLDLALTKAGEILESNGQGGSILIIADSVEAEAGALRDAHQSAGAWPLQFLAITPPDSDDLKSMRSAAKSLRTSVEEFTVDDSDISSIIRKAARAPSTSTDDTGARWQEAGYWLTPILGLLLAFSFRRENRAPKDPA